MKSQESLRLDKALVFRGLVSSRARGCALLDEGKVVVNGVVVLEHDHEVKNSDMIELLARDHEWVSRSALKLIHALDYWGVEARGKVALDIGASTGGFTEVLLHRGATKVYALDVGHGQLVKKIADDPRVINREGVHINHVVCASFDPLPSLIVIDVSFISLTKILSKVKELCGAHGEVVALVKPQFEVGRGAINKGIVKDATLQASAVASVRSYAESVGFVVSESIISPILGGDGNKEFLLHLTSK